MSAQSTFSKSSNNYNSAKTDSDQEKQENSENYGSVNLNLDKLKELYDSKSSDDKSQWALRTTRNWTNMQFVAIKAAISILLTNVMWNAVRAQDNGNSINFSQYVLMFALVAILFAVFRFERANNQIEDQREEKRLQLKQSKIAQMLSLRYLFNNILPEADDIQQQVNIIKVVPRMMALIDADEVKKEVSTGFQLIADLTTIISDKVDNIKKEVKEVKDNKDLESILASIQEIPRPKKKDDLSNLTPNDERFPDS